MNRHDPQDHETLASYDAFAATFAKSRVGKYWPEFDVLVGEIGKRAQNTPLKILDIGCGGGRLVETLGSLDFPINYHGIDESSGMIQEAHKAHPDEKFEVLDMRSISKIQDNFDIIAFVASFHHLNLESDRNTVLQEVKHHLKPDGCVFMTNWNLLSVTNQKKYAPQVPGGRDFDVKIGSAVRYYHGFDTDELDALLKNTGFRDIVHQVGDRNITTIARV